MSISLRHPCTLALAAFVALSWFAPPVRAAAMLPPPDVRPKDFAFIKKDGVYHLFYIRHNDLLPPFATENDFGHAVSTDLYHWAQLPPVMAVDPFGWDNLHVWAPHIIESAGLYWMFYTGVSSIPGQANDTQRLGVAVSSDLMTWNRMTWYRPFSEPVWQNSLAPWAWWAPMNAGMACRDPFVMEDPNAPGQFLMYYTASPASDSVSTLVGVARSPGPDFSSWADEKPLWITHRSYTFNALTESPHLFQHNGRWFLFLSANASQSLTFYVSDDPLGEPEQWTYRGRLRNMLGYDTSLWFASEYLRDGDAELFAHCAASLIQIHRIVWGTGDNFLLAEPAFFHVVSMAWTRSSVRENEPVGLCINAANWYAFSGHLQAFVRKEGGGEMPAPLDTLGLEAKPTLTGDSTLVVWLARRWPPTLDLHTPMSVRVAMDDGSATTPWLSVCPNTLVRTPPHGRPDRAPDEPVDEFAAPDTTLDSLASHAAHAASAAAAGRGAGLALRTLGRTPLGEGPAVTFALAQAGPVQVDVFDLQGRKVVALANRGLAAGTHVLPWNGRDAAGARVARGLYFVRVVTPEQSSSARILIDR